MDAPKPTSSRLDRYQRKPRRAAVAVTLLALLVAAGGIAYFVGGEPPERPVPTRPERVFVYEEATPAPVATTSAPEAPAEPAVVEAHPKDELKEALLLVKDYEDFVRLSARRLRSPELGQVAEDRLVAEFGDRTDAAIEGVQKLRQLAQTDPRAVDRLSELTRDYLFTGCLCERLVGVAMSAKYSEPNQRLLPAARKMAAAVWPSVLPETLSKHLGLAAEAEPTEPREHLRESRGPHERPLTPEPEPPPSEVLHETSEEDRQTILMAENLMANGGHEAALNKLEPLLWHDLAPIDRERVEGMIQQLKDEQARE